MRNLFLSFQQSARPLVAAFKRLTRITPALKAGGALLAVITAAFLVILAITFIFPSITPTARAVSTTIVISQFQVAGGGASAAADEFVELHNVSASPVDLNGLRVVYRSAAGTSDVAVANWTTTTTIPAGGYYLLTNSAGYDGAVAGDITWTTGATGTFAAAGGGIALRNGAVNTGTIVDSVGYGTATNAFVEATVEPAPTANTSAARMDNGCTDTDNNADDFLNLNPSNPRNASSTALTCGSGGGVTLSVNDVSQTEGNAGSTAFTFTVSLSSSTHGGVTFNIATADGTAQDDNPATEDNDYQANSVTGVSIPNGSQTTQFTVQVNGDTTTEPNETFFVNVTDLIGATASDAQGQGTIINDDITLTPIHDIQGPGSSSPIVGASVTTRGIVTGVKSNGFFIQEPDATVDADPATSEGIFVFTSSTPPAAAAIGALVQVTATVVEFVPSADPLQPPLTELSSPTVAQISTGNPLPPPVALTATFPDPAGPFDQLERVEGMRVSVASLTVVGPTQGNVNEPNATATSNGVFYGVVTGVARPFREPGIQAPDPPPSGSIPPIPRFDANPERIRVDSDVLSGATQLNVRSGAVVNGLVGPLDYTFRTYTILPDPTPVPVATGGTTATAVTAPTSAEFTVASYNFERFFDTVNDPAIGEPVLTAAAYDKRLNKASLGVRDYLRAPDILGVVEVENLTTLQDLANRINSDATANLQPNPMYAAYLVEGNDIGGIDVGFLVKTATIAGSTPRVTVNEVVQEGKTTLFVNPDASTELLNDRPSLRLNAVINYANGTSFAVTVIVNHLRSLNGVEGIGPGTNGWPTEGARVRAKRQAQAEYLANLVQARQTANPNERIILVGDFNAFEFIDGFTDSMGTILGTPAPDNQTAVPGDGVDLVNPDLTILLDVIAQRYSFIFDGNAQSLDHVVINQALINSTSTRRVEHPRINADFAALDRNLTTVERLADHDPLVGFFQPLACTINCPGNIAVNAPADQCGANVTYNAPTTSSGDCGGAAVTCSPTSGSFFSIGATIVTCSAPAGSCTFTVTVNDTQNPTLVCPANQVGVTNISAPNIPVPVGYPAPTVNDNCSATYSCTPPSGSNFPPGITTITCQAIDAANNMSATCSFTVTVRQPRAAIRDLINRVQTYVPPLTPAQANELKGQLELANTRVEQGQLIQACTHLQNFIDQVTVLAPPLAAAQSQVLFSYANKIRNALGCAGGPFPSFRAQTVGLYLAEQGEFKLKNHLTSGPAELSQPGGEPDDQPVAGDWDGDGIDTVGVYRDGIFYLRNTGGLAAAPGQETGRLNKRAEIVVAFGQAGDVPVVGDWDGDGRDTIGVYRQGQFLLRNTNTAGAPELVIQLGGAGDLPLAGDWDGDGVVTVGIYQAGNGAFQLRNGHTEGAGEVLVLWGGVDYLPIVGDWDGDGMTTVGLYSRTGEFLLRNTNTAGPAEIVLTLGLADGIPLAGDWDGLP